jgi:hypothetical protein
MAEIVDLIVSFAVSTTALALLLSWDERRLSDEALARAWPVSTRRIAIVVGGVLCLPLHFARTRRTVLGFFLGVAWMIGVGLLTGLVSTVVEWALGIPE